MQTLSIWGYGVIGDRFGHPVHNPKFNRHGYFEVEPELLPEYLHHGYEPDNPAIKVGGYGLRWMNDNWGKPSVLIHTKREFMEQVASLRKVTGLHPGAVMDSIQKDERMFANFKRHNPNIPVCVLYLSDLESNPKGYFERLAEAVNYRGSIATALLNKELGHA
tara:strand:+ start:569 stop:1057 length:489 start_codon:yes stop_codon:yes gene_type:complete